ncbi:ADP-ribosyltransferase [Nocardia sp. NPDC004604]|uniref:ADP-ribosyltransferase n=1 Tax=Nocardia sp. NPDC004604 TaxID=3157013 RepID=UPI0033B1BE53
MTATVLDVDTSVYYDAGNKLVSLAADWFASVDSFWPTLNECHAMTGSYDEAKKWAKTYDTRAEELLDMSNDLAEAVHAYGVLLLEMGYNHAVADYNATIGTDTPAPDKPATPGPVAYLCRVPLPSAGGPGQGLIDGGVQLAEAIGITIPDGNVDLLARAADTWTKIADTAPVATMAGELERVAWSFEAIVSPEYEHIDEDLRALRDAALTTTAAFYELSASAKDHHDGLVELRENMKKVLEDLGEELLKELLITVAIAIAASVVTFGIGAAVASARVVAIAARFARPIRALIDAFKANRAIAKGVKSEQTLAKHAKELKRIKDLKAKATPKVEPKATPKEFKAPTAKELGLTDEEYAAISRYTGSGYKDLNEALRSGNLTEEQAARVRELNAALDKLPNYEGEVNRKVQLPADVINSYKKGEDITEDAFTSTSRFGENNKFDGNTEFTIISKTGKPIENMSNYGPWSGQNEGEILFKSGTKFRCLENTVDPKTMRNVITLVEL